MKAGGDFVSFLTRAWCALATVENGEVKTRYSVGYGQSEC